MDIKELRDKFFKECCVKQNQVLEERFLKDNHKKYHHFFKEWIINLTDGQILGFSIQEQKRNIYEK